MTVFVVIVEDRHTEPEAHIFSTLEKALDYAGGVADEYGYVDDDPTVVPEWHYFRRLSGDGDCVWVTDTELDSDAR